MKKLSAVIASAVAVIAITVISMSVVYAQVSDDDSSPSRFSTKLAELLGIDVTKVDEAIKTARTELRKEDISEQLRRAVESGKMTQEQADEKLEAMKDMPVMKGKGHQWRGHWPKSSR
jgi:3-hydroxyacyl-CoA dehydrogenase